MNWDEVKREYETTNITLKELAEKHRIKIGTVKSRKSRDKWLKDATLKGATKQMKVAKKKGCNQQQKSKSFENVEALVISDELTDKQKLFCIYYIKSFNATQSAIKAGYASESAHVAGSRLLSNDKVANEIRRIKSDMQQNIFVDAMDVLNKYIKIAFADISDFVEFGNRTVSETVNDDEETFETSYVEIKNSNEVDGSIIQEVKKGKEGISIKLHDKMKALEKLEKYFDLLPDHHKRKLEEEKSSLDKKKFELDKRVVELREREESKKAW